MRTLRSKRLRAALFAGTDGKCAICREPLSANWEADHIEPWAITQRTNVHEMQPLCMPCNRKKGARMTLEKRRHQKMGEAIRNQILDGAWRKKIIVADVTPGGGKTSLALIIGAGLLSGGAVQQVFHFVPRAALRKQVEIDWIRKPDFNPDGHELIASENKVPLYVPPFVGVVASYDQLAANPQLYIDKAKQKPTLAVFDEIQFLMSDLDNGIQKTWARHAISVAEVSRWGLAMSGTLYRHDGEPIPFIEYDEMSDGRRVATNVDIRYTLAEAIEDNAIKPMEFMYLDGSVKFLIDDGEIETILSQAQSEQQSRALRTFLQRKETWAALVDNAIAHWREWRNQVYPSRIIVVASDQKHAREIHAYIESKHGLPAGLAISDIDDSHDTIDTFRGDPEACKPGTPEVLVTVAMASVGFDAPDVTHMVYLSHIRSRPWMLQAFARATRIDPRCSIDAEFQKAFIFLPDDKALAAFVQWLRGELEEGKRRRRKPGPDDGIWDGPIAPPPLFVPISAVPGQLSFETVLNGRLSPDDSALVEAYIKGCPAAAGIAPSKLIEIIRFNAAPKVAPAAPVQVASERIGRKRGELQRLSNLHDHRRGAEKGATQKHLWAKYGKGVEARSESEIDDGIAWVKNQLRDLDHA